MKTAPVNTKLPRHRRRDYLTQTALAALLALCCFGPNPAMADGDVELGERWREHSYGVSLRPPLGAKLVSYTADDALLRVYHPQGFSVILYIKKSAVDVEMDGVISKAIHQLGTLYPSAAILKEQRLKQADLDAGLIYFRIPDQRRGPWVMGQAFVQLNPQALVMLQLEADAKQYPAAQEVFEAVFKSLEVQNPNQLNEQRAEAVQNGQAWREAFDSQRLHDSLQPERWLRIIDNDTEIGYIRTTQQKAKHLKNDGVRVDIQSRIHLRDQAYDSISSFFLSDDGHYEFWSIRATVRPLMAKSARAQAQSWAETGVRSHDKITVSLERPSGVDNRRWKKPPQGYMSQVEIHMLEQVLGPQTREPMGFYAYYPNAQTIVYRTVSTQRDQDGSFTIHTRPAPDQEQQVSYYNPKGELIKRVLPGGQVLMPTTKQRVTARWRQ